MRISAGEFKGRKIGTKKLFAKRAGKDDLRPTPAKVREAIFDILRNEVEGASVLDLYAGTGTIGFEALSRGAESVVFVESVRPRAKAIGDLIDKLNLAAKASVQCEETEQFLKRASLTGETYDIIFADPPYASDEIEKIVPLINNYGILDAQGVLLCEHGAKAAVPEAAGSLKLRKQYKYGDTRLALYRKEP
ncbi:MAG: 16S rRNA (guanine(966)-N(2))-methyltransferase RsmD [Nitrospirota bacterium]|nr:16S rRNA (guanine(966)-N(2))-methyltransferase RsmD [Nitrospirota bacterium]